MQRRPFRLIALIALLAFSGRPAAAQPAPQDAADDFTYRLGAGDDLTVHFLLNPEMDAKVTIGPDGRAVFPYLSAVRVSGMTVEQVDQLLTGAYGKILRNPQVETIVTAYANSQVYVGGEVRQPGAFPIRGQVTTAKAVMLAGGLSPTARTGKVVVLREDAAGVLHSRTVDLNRMLKSGGSQDNFLVQPGDLVFVPRSGIAEVNLFVEQYINGVLPFSRSVGYQINRGDFTQ